MNDTDVVTSPKWMKSFRGANGALQWLCTNTRPDLAVDTSKSAGTAGIGITKASLSKMHKIYGGRHMLELLLEQESNRSIQRHSYLQHFIMLDGPLDQMDHPKEVT